MGDIYLDLWQTLSDDETGFFGKIIFKPMGPFVVLRKLTLIKMK